MQLSASSTPCVKHDALSIISVFPSFLIPSQHTCRGPQLRRSRAGRQVKRICLPWPSWRGETLRGDEVKQTESRDRRERQPRKKSRKSNSASLCSCAGKFPLQTLMYNHMLNPLIRWPQDSQLRNNWWVVGIGVVVLMTFMVFSNTKSLSYWDHWSNYLLFREPSWAETGPGPRWAHGIWQAHKLQSLMCFLFAQFQPIRSCFCPHKSSSFIPVLPKNGTLSLKRSCPQDELRWENRSYSEADHARSGPFCMCQLTSADWMCSSRAGGAAGLSNG